MPMHCKAESLLEDIHHLVQDELKVVSYKWLARQYQIPSNTSKQLLFQYVQQQGSRVKAIYLVSGRLQENPSRLITRLVGSAELEACCAELAEEASVHVHSVLPAEPHPVTDPERLCAEDTLQARQLYQSLLQHTTDGSADVLAKNTCSSVTFDVTVATPTRKQQQQQQHAAVPPTGSGSAAGGTGPRAAEAGEADPPAAKRHKQGSWIVDPVSGEEVWQDEATQLPVQQGDGPTTAPAAAVAALAPPGGNRQQQQQQQSRGDGPTIAAGGKSSAASTTGGGRVGGKVTAGSKGGKGLKGSKAGGQKNITSFFKK